MHDYNSQHEERVRILRLLVESEISRLTVWRDVVNTPGQAAKVGQLEKSISNVSDPMEWRVLQSGSDEVDGMESTGHEGVEDLTCDGGTYGRAFQGAWCSTGTDKARAVRSKGRHRRPRGSAFLIGGQVPSGIQEGHAGKSYLLRGSRNQVLINISGYRFGLLVHL